MTNLPAFVRRCPSCQGIRPVSELYCGNLLTNGPCGWYLADEPPIQGGCEQEPSTRLASRLCTNGHQLGPGDAMCILCGADPAGDDISSETTPESPIRETIIDEWRAIQQIPSPQEPWDRFVVRHSSTDQNGVLTLYHCGFDPDPGVQAILRRIPRDYAPELIATGQLCE